MPCVRPSIILINTNDKTCSLIKDKNDKMVTNDAFDITDTVLRSFYLWPTKVL